MLEYIKFMAAAPDDGGRRTEERGCNFNVGKGGRERGENRKYGIAEEEFFGDNRCILSTFGKGRVCCRVQFSASFRLFRSSPLS